MEEKGPLRAAATSIRVLSKGVAAAIAETGLYMLHRKMIGKLPEKHRRSLRGRHAFQASYEFSA